MMARTQITLDPEMQHRARARAAELQVSFAEYIRGLVARDLAQPARREVDRSIVFGLGSSGGSDIARDKDTMLGQAVASEQQRPR